MGETNVPGAVSMDAVAVLTFNIGGIKPGIGQEQ